MRLLAGGGGGRGSRFRSFARTVLHAPRWAPHTADGRGEKGYERSPIVPPKLRFAFVVFKTAPLKQSKPLMDAGETNPGTKCRRIKNTKLQCLGCGQFYVGKKVKQEEDLCVAVEAEIPFQIIFF